jgi:hypothetical protein
MRYIVVWRRSPTARFLDVQLDDASRQADYPANIAVFTGEPENTPLISDEADLISYVNSTETDTRAVEADLAHRVLGWTIPA